MGEEAEPWSRGGDLDALAGLCPPRTASHGLTTVERSMTDRGSDNTQFVIRIQLQAVLVFANMAGPKNFTFRPRGNENIELFRSGRIEGTIELIYWHPVALTRHRAAPLIKEREEFLLHLLRQGTSRTSVQTAAGLLLQAVNALQLRRLRDLNLHDINDATQTIWGYRLTKASTFHGHCAAYVFRSIVKKFLSFHGRLKGPRPLRQAFWNQLDRFCQFSQSRHLSPNTVESHRLKVASFLGWFSMKKKSLSRVSVSDVDRFIATKKANGWSSATVASTTQALRLFFRYAETQRWCPSIADGIKAPYHCRIVAAPQGRTWSEVTRLLEATNGTDLAAIRAKAALSLISTYALRSSEMAQLLLSDFDWKKTTLTVRRSKRGQQQRYPIAPEVRRAVLNYIKVRPRCGYRNLFISLWPRYRPIGRSSFYDLTSDRLKKLGITTGRLGPHAIRHARAMQLLRAGTSVAEIGDFLGQRRPESPLSYAKFDAELLRGVADFKLDGLL